MSALSTPAVGAATTPPSTQGPVPLTQSRPRRFETVVRWILRACAGLSVAITVGILFSLLSPALQFFREVPVLDFLTGTRWTPQFADPEYGVLPLISATAWTTVIALAVAIPLGLGAAVYLAEYARPGVRKTLKPILELLAGVPTVVFGFFALSFVAPVVLNEWLSLEVGTFSILAAGLVMGVMIVPTIASLSEDAMTAVPQALRQGSAALGANRMQTTLRVVFPAALSGVVAAIVLGISRAIGETMIVAIAAGARTQMVTTPTMEGATMTGFIARTALGDARVGSLEYNTLFAVGLVLFVLTLLVNMISIKLVRRFRQEY